MNPTAPRDHPLPVHLVAGPLGVGKTTAILSYVERHAGREHVAVLVNDFGPIGMDGAIMQGAIGRVVGDQMKVLTIPGGCLCCASADALATGLPRLTQLPGVTRVIIEPSGIAMPAQVVDLARSLADEHHLDIRPSIVLLDVAEFAAETAQRMPYYRRLVEAADVLVGNRADKASASAVNNFRGWAERLDPPKLRVITTTMGELPDAVFELRADAAAPPRHAHEHDHHHADDRHAGGQTWDASTVFRLSTLRELLRDAALERFKGIFHTDAGWKLLEQARGELTERFTDHRRDNRADWIAEEQHAPDDLAARLDQCALP
jgi:G3E family GTPase